MAPFACIQKACKGITTMKRLLALAALTLTIGALAPAQESTGQRVVVPARNTSRPRVVKASLLNGGITVKTHSGTDVIVEATESASPRRGRERDRAPDG